jgi:hypothetical protein
MSNLKAIVRQANQQKEMEKHTVWEPKLSEMKAEREW